MIATEHLLTDEQMRHFISHGYVVLETDFPKSFHEDVQQKIETVMDNEGNPGNNILPRVPEIQQIFDHPTVRGALTSVLGPEYVMHPHRHCHFSQPGRRVQRWHKDSYWGYYKMRNHHPWWAMIFYYPQDVTEEMGPSAIMPGTQYYHSRAGDESEVEINVLGEAGTFALIHYDLWHKGTSNVSARNRSMLKFQFVRMQPPASPTWNNEQLEWQAPAGELPKNEHQVIWRHMWSWLSGDESPTDQVEADTGPLGPLIDALSDNNQFVRLAATDKLGLKGPAGQEAIPALAEALADELEPVAVNAAYALANMGQPAVTALAAAMKHTSKNVIRNAAYGLSAVGDPAFAGLVDALDYQSEEARGDAAFALGELRQVATEAVPKIVELTGDEAEWVRRNAVEALGTIGRPVQQTVPALAEALLRDPDDQVRFTAALSLARIGASAGEAVPSLKGALRDDNRYVRANAFDALARIGTPEANQVLVRSLQSARWCPSTTPDSTF